MSISRQCRQCGARRANTGRHSREINWRARVTPGRGEPLEHRAGGGVGGDERLQRQLVEGDVPGRAEVRDRRVEAQVTLRVREVQREHHVRRAGGRSACGGGGASSASSSRSATRRGSPVRSARRSRRWSRCPAHSAQVAHVGREAVGAQAQPVDVHRRGEHRRVEHGEQRTDGAVGHDDVAAAVDHQRREGLVAGEQVLQGAAHRLETARVEPRLRVGRGEAGGEQQGVALAQRDLQVLAEVDQQLPAGPGPPGLDEAQVAGGDADVEGEVHLAAAPPGAPPAQQVAGAGAGVEGAGHGPDRRTVPAPGP